MEIKPSWRKTHPRDNTDYTRGRSLYLMSIQQDHPIPRLCSLHISKLMSHSKWLAWSPLSAKKIPSATSFKNRNAWIRSRLQRWNWTIYPPYGPCKHPHRGYVEDWGSFETTTLYARHSTGTRELSGLFHQLFSMCASWRQEMILRYLPPHLREGFGHQSTWRVAFRFELSSHIS